MRKSEVIDDGQIEICPFCGSSEIIYKINKVTQEITKKRMTVQCKCSKCGSLGPASCGEWISEWNHPYIDEELESQLDDLKVTAIAKWNHRFN